MIDMGNDVALVLPDLVECQQGLFLDNADKLRIRADHGTQHGNAAEEHIIHVLLLTHGDGVLKRDRICTARRLVHEDGSIFGRQACVEHVRDSRFEKGRVVFSMDAERNNEDAGHGLCRCGGRGNESRTHCQQADQHDRNQNLFFHLYVTPLSYVFPMNFPIDRHIHF